MSPCDRVDTAAGEGAVRGAYVRLFPIVASSRAQCKQLVERLTLS
jgi:hypothetical protein